jgi:hypothetical protein
MSHVVDPTLFERVSEYSTDIQSGDVDVDEPLSDTTPIIVFCENFFAQFLKTELGYTLKRIDGKAKEAVIRIRIQRKLRKGPATSLIAMFEETCDIWPEALGRSYGMSRSEFAYFHETYLAQLLEAIVTWAGSIHDEEVASAATNARGEYAEALEALRQKL